MAVVAQRSCSACSNRFAPAAPAGEALVAATSPHFKLNHILPRSQDNHSLHSSNPLGEIWLSMACEGDLGKTASPYYLRLHQGRLILHNPTRTRTETKTTAVTIIIISIITASVSNTYVDKFPRVVLKYFDSVISMCGCNQCPIGRYCDS